MKSYTPAILAFACASLVGAQNASQQSAPPPPAAVIAPAITPQVLGEMLRSATTFNDLARSLNLKNSLGPDVHAAGPDGLPRHTVVRTAQTIGAGAGVGAAIG